MYNALGRDDVYVECLMSHWHAGFQGDDLDLFFGMGCFDHWATQAGLRARGRALSDRSKFLEGDDYG